MKILIISEYFPPDQGGASSRISILIYELAKYHDVTLITSSPHYPKPVKSEIRFFKPIRIYRERGVKIIRLWMPFFEINSSIGRILNYLYFTFISLLGLSFIKKPDIIWSTSPNVFCGFTAKMAKFLRGGISIANIDDIWPEGPKELGFLKSKFSCWLGENLCNFSVHGVDAITTISETISDYYYKKYNVHNIYLIPVGIENKRLETIIQYSSTEKIQNIKNNQNNQIIFMYSGILGPAYDFELMLRAFSILRKNSEIKLIIRGTGPLKPFLRDLIKKLNLKNVILESKYLSLEELNKKLLSADVFLLPMVDNFISKTALPAKLFEYMAIGKPILVYGNGEPKNLIENVEAGLVCIGGGYKKFAESIELMLNSQNNWDVWGKNGQKYVQKNFSSKVIVNKVNTMFDELKFKNRS
jgi:glycosyltransferase involved in cell wall biosynthesis